MTSADVGWDHPVRWMRSFLVVAVLVVVAGAVPTTVWAHAELDRADPSPGSNLDQAPAQLQLFFTEAVDPSFSRAQLLNDTGNPVDRGDSHVAPNDPRSLIVSLPSGLANGVYTVSWRTLSAVDGHQVNGAYPLILGPMPPEGLPATTASLSQAVFSNETAIGRWWFSLAASLLFGAPLSWHVVFRSLFGKANAGALPIAARRAQKLAMWAGVLLVIGTLYGALAQASASAGVPLWGVFGGPLVDLLSRGRFAALWWPRLGLVGLTFGLVYWCGVDSRWGRVALGVAWLSLLTSSLNSHAAALLSGAYLAVVVDWLHFAGVGAWLGGLASLVFVLPVALKASPGSGERVLARAVTRFSNLALIAVGVIVASGTFQAWLEVGSWAGMLQTAYGLSVSVKIALLLVTLALGAFNLLLVRPRLAVLVGKQSVAAAILARRFAVAVRVEPLS